MASTPESKVKKKIKHLLDQLHDKYQLYYHMPVQNGMGEPTLDFVGWVHGRPFAIETKAPGKKPTARQLETIDEMLAGGALVLIYDGTNDEALKQWLTHLFGR